MARQGGGTAVPETRSWSWLIALIVVTPAVAFAVHRVSSGSMCGWDYGGVGGACRAIILISIIAGVAAGVFAALAARAFAKEHVKRGWLFAGLALVIAVLAILFARQFADYMRSGRVEMEDAMCTFARETLPDCVEQEWSKLDAESVRRAQPNCLADERSMADYQRCMPLQGCRQILECIRGR
jgi:hypothetical protein